MNLEELQCALFDAYDIKNALSNKIKNTPKDADSDYTIGDCLDTIICFLESLECATDETRSYGRNTECTRLGS
jgi:hypothetical protein